MAAVLTSNQDDFVSNWSRAVAKQLKIDMGLRLADIGEDSLAGLLETEVRTLFAQNITLSNARPDFESILAQLMSAVEQEAPWADTDISATAQMLMRMVSAVGTMNQFGIARALSDAFHFTAWSDTAILTNARDLGNRLTRARSASALATISRGDPGLYLGLAPYTEFRVTDGVNILTMFNRDTVVFGDTDISATFMLYEGSVQNTQITSTGVPYQVVEFGSETLAISDTDIIVKVDGVTWTKAADDKPLWQYSPTDKVYEESTLPNGNVELLFGNGKTGTAPPAGVPITIQWIETKGAGANSSSSNMQVSIKSAPSGLGNVVGSLGTTLQNGVDALSANFFRLFAADRAASRKRAVRRLDHSALVIGDYPGVYDARFLGQAEVAPRRPSMMNIVHATLLTDPVWSDADWNTFVTWMAERDIYKTVFVRRDPTALVWNITANIFCDPAANLAVIGQQAAAAVRDSFNPAKRLINASREMSSAMLTLGYSWYKSDLTDVLKLQGTPSYDLVQYVQLDPSITDMVCPDVFHWVKLGTLTLNVGYTRRGGYSGRLDNIGHTIEYDANGVLKVD